MYCREAREEGRMLETPPPQHLLSRPPPPGPDSHRFLDDVEALLVYLKGGHLLDDLLQEDVLFVVVAFD